MENGKLDIIEAACTHQSITDFNHLVKLSSTAIQIFVEGGKKDEDIIKLAKDLLKAVSRLIGGVERRIKECASAILENSEMKEAWLVLC